MSEEKKDVTPADLKSELDSIDSMVALAWNQKPSAKTHTKIKYSRSQLRQLLTQKVSELQIKVLSYYALSAAVKESEAHNEISKLALEIYSEAAKRYFRG